MKLRDAAALIMDACEGYLEAKAPVKKFGPDDYDKLDWTQKDGTKGPYLQTSKDRNLEQTALPIFESLRQQILEHDGFWQTSQHLYWFHRNDQNTIDRRAKA